MIVREKVEQVIGKGFADKLDEQIFKVDESFGYTRREMVENLGCANFIAAARLAKVLRRLAVNSPARLNKLDPFSLARAKGIGESALFVAMCILDASGYDVIKWWGFKGNQAKFSSFKSHAISHARKRKQEVA
jgi:hypothetical protein